MNEKNRRMRETSVIMSMKKQFSESTLQLSLYTKIRDSILKNVGVIKSMGSNGRMEGCKRKNKREAEKKL